MSWFTPILLTPEGQRATTWLATTVSAAGYGAPTGASRASAGLGSAHAGSQWAWAVAPVRPAARPAEPTTARAPHPGASLRAPVELLSQMADAASALGRSESDVWVEAAREWLRRRAISPVTPPAAPAQSAEPRRIARVWDDIDALLTELRAPVPSCDHQGVPAA